MNIKEIMMQTILQDKKLIEICNIIWYEYDYDWDMLVFYDSDDEELSCEDIVLKQEFIDKLDNKLKIKSKDYYWRWEFSNNPVEYLYDLIKKEWINN